MLKSAGDYNRYSCYSWDEFCKKNLKNYPFKRTQANEILKRFAKLCHEEIYKNPEGLKIFKIGTIIISGAAIDVTDRKRSTQEKRVLFRNVKTNQVVYTSHYIYGRGRGKCLLSLLWKFRNTVPFRRQMKRIIDENKHHHWFVTKNLKDILRIGIDYDKARSNKSFKKLSQGS